MASIIDALVVTLTLDGSSFQRQLGVAQKRLDAMSDSMRKTGASGEQMGLGVIKGATGASLALRGLTTAFVALPLAAAAAAAGVAKAFLTVSAAVTKADRDILTMSRMSDIPAARMNAIGAVAERYHGSRQGAEQAMANLTGKLQAIRMGRGDQDFLNNAVNYGINTRGTGAAGIATTEEFRRRLIADMHRRAQQGDAGRMAAYQEGRDFGLDTGTIEAATQSQNYEGELSKQEELAGVTPGGLRSSEKWGQALSDLDNAWQGALRKLIEPLEKNLAPLIEDRLVPAIVALGEKFKLIDWDKLTKTLGDGMSKFITAVGNIDWQKAADTFVDFLHVLEYLFGKTYSLGSLFTSNLPEDDPRSTFGEGWAEAKGLFHSKTLTPAEVSQNEKDIRDELAKTPGVDENAQNAVLGAIFDESGFDPQAKENNGAGPGRGLPQWTPQDRKDRIEAYMGKPIEKASAAEQTRAMMWEMQTYYPQVWAIVTDPNASRDDKTRAITRTYLAPADRAGRVLQDISRARDFADPGRKGDRAQHTPAPKPPPAPVVHPPELNTTPFITGWNQTADGARHLAAYTPDQMASAAANNNNVTIGNVTVHSAATDAAGLARDLHGALAAQFGNPLHLALGANTAVA
jgi:Phage tail lysozyme